MKHFKLNLRVSSKGVCNTYILILTLLALLIPNLALCVTEPYSLTTMLASLLIPGGFYLLWMIFLRRPGWALLGLFPFMFLGAFQLVIMYLFNGSIIATDMFTNLFTTSVSEAGELLGNISPAIFFVCVVYLPLIILGILFSIRKIRFSCTQLRSFALIGSLSMILGTIFAGISEYRNPAFALNEHIFPVNVIYNIRLSLQNWERSKNFLESSRDFHFHATREILQTDSTGVPPREIYVFIIGEASRAASWSLFGYERPTTPRLSAKKGIVPFSDMLTQSNTTHKSVPIILSPCSAENYDSIYSRKSMVTLFKEAGFHTAFISNEPPNRSLIDYFADEADTVIDVTPHELEKQSIRHYDEEILPYLRQIIRNTPGNLFIVLHTYGSHFAYTERYPDSFRKFLPDQSPVTNPAHRKEVVNSYDNSILYTDYILSQIIDILDKSKACTALLYCADHGEDLMDDARERFLHASPTTTYYQLHVASLGWFSERYKQLFPTRYQSAEQNKSSAVTTANLFHTIGDIAGIRSPYLNPAASLVNSGFREQPRMYIDDHNRDIPIIQSGLTELDLQQFRQHHLKYDSTTVKKIRY